MDGLHFSRRINLALSFCCDADLNCLRNGNTQGRQTCSLQQAINRLCVSSVHYPFEEGEPRMLPYLLKWKKVYDAIYWFRLKLAQAKGQVLLQTRQTRSCTARRHLNLKRSRKSRYSVSLRETAQAGPPTQPKQNCFDQLMCRENIHCNPWAQHEETVIHIGTRDLMRKVVKLTPRIDQKIPGSVTSRGSKKRSTSKEPHLQSRPVCPATIPTRRS